MNKYHKVLLSSFLVLLFISGVILVSKNQNFLLPVFSQDPTTYDPTVWDGVGTPEVTEPDTTISAIAEPTCSDCDCPSDCATGESGDTWECAEYDCDSGVFVDSTTSSDSFAAATAGPTPRKIAWKKRPKPPTTSPSTTSSTLPSPSPSASPSQPCGNTAPACNGACMIGSGICMPDGAGGCNCGCTTDNDCPNTQCYDCIAGVCKALGDCAIHPCTPTFPVCVPIPPTNVCSCRCTGDAQCAGTASTPKCCTIMGIGGCNQCCEDGNSATCVALNVNLPCCNSSNTCAGRTCQCGGQPKCKSTDCFNSFGGYLPGCGP